MFINPKKLNDNDVLNIIDNGYATHHILAGTPAYRTWLEKCYAEAVRRGFRKELSR